MATQVIMPQMGESIAEGTITKWYKKVGERVERDEPLFEISTDKVDTEIPAPTTGILNEIRVKEGETVPVNTVVAVIGAEGEVVSEPAPADEAPAAFAPAVQEAASVAGDRDRAARSSPLVRRMVREHGMDLAQLTGTGRGGRITKADVLRLLEKAPVVAVARVSPPVAAPAARPVAAKAAAPPPLPVSVPIPAPAPAEAAERASRVERVPMGVMRKSIAEHMILSRRTSAHVTTVFEADVTRIVKLREDYKERFQREEGVSLTYTPFFIRAAVGGLKAFPIVNASLEGDTIVYKKDINIGVAVALDWGLIVPVIRQADERSFLGLARAVVDLAERARQKKLLPEEVKEGTFTLTNPGPYGGLFGTPIINQPQLAILGVGGIHRRPVVVNDAIAIRSMVYLALSFDHRLIDGALADQFMAEVKRRLENWEEKIL